MVSWPRLYTIISQDHGVFGYIFTLFPALSQDHGVYELAKYCSLLSSNLYLYVWCNSQLCQCCVVFYRDLFSWTYFLDPYYWHECTNVIRQLSDKRDMTEWGSDKCFALLSWVNKAVRTTQDHITDNLITQSKTNPYPNLILTSETLIAMKQSSTLTIPLLPHSMNRDGDAPSQHHGTASRMEQPLLGALGQNQPANHHSKAPMIAGCRWLDLAALETYYNTCSFTPSHQYPPGTRLKASRVHQALVVEAVCFYCPWYLGR